MTTNDDNPIVTLCAVMEPGSSRVTTAGNQMVRIKMPRETARRAINHAVNPKYAVKSKPFSGYDANDNLFRIDVGYTHALWIEEEEA